jgi:hypothetical protein
VGIKPKVVQNVVEKGRESAFVPLDGQGRHGGHKEIPEAVNEGIRNHITSFQPLPSHYSRKNTTKLYLPSDLNLAQMYRMYTEECKKNGRPIAPLHHYRKIFCGEFNLSFFVPNTT